MAVPDLTPLETENEGDGFPIVMLKTSPVGVPVTFVPAAGGIVTTNPSFCPAPLYKVDFPVMLSLTQKGLPPERVSPQPLTRSESVALVTRSVRTYCAGHTAGRTNIEMAEAAMSFQQFTVNLMIVISFQNEFSIANRLHVIAKNLGWDWAKVYLKQTEFQLELARRLCIFD
jgi:hypothetical protein